MPRPLLTVEPTPAPRAATGLSRTLFTFDAAAGQLVDALGVPGTFARTTPGTTVDSTGAVRWVPAGQPRWRALDLDGDGVREALGLLLERASSNLVPWSQAIAAHWTALSGALLTDDVLRLGDLSLSLVRSAGGAASAAQSGALAAFASGGPKGFSFVVAPAAPLDPAGVAVALAADGVGSRWMGTITFGGDGTPVVVASTGLVLGVEPLGGGAWRVSAQTTAVTAAQTHRVYCYPNASGTAAGAVLFGGAQAESLPYPTSYLPTAGAGAVARTADTLAFPALWRAQDVTLAVEFARPVWAGLATLARIPLQLGTRAAGSAYLYDAGDGLLGVFRNDPSGSTGAGAPVPAATRGAMRERLAWGAQVTGWGTRGTAPGVRALTAAGQASASLPAGSTPSAAWDAPTLTLAPDAYALDGVLLVASVAPGLRTLDEMRGLR